MENQLCLGEVEEGAPTLSKDFVFDRYGAAAWFVAWQEWACKREIRSVLLLGGGLGRVATTRAWRHLHH